MNSELRKFLLLTCLALLLTSVPAFASNTTSNFDEIRSLIKKAGKLTHDGSFAEAESLLRRAVEIDPSSSDAKVELAYVLVKQRKLLDAYNICLPVIERERNNSRAYAVMGAMLLSAGRFPDARAFFVSAIRLNRKEHLAWAGAGMLEFYENRVDDGFKYLLNALDLRPDEPDYLFACAQAAGRAELFKEAADHYEHFLRVSSKVDNDRRERIQGLIDFLRILGKRGKLYSTDGRDQTSIPFEIEDDRPIIKLRINDKADRSTDPRTSSAVRAR